MLTPADQIIAARAALTGGRPQPAPPLPEAEGGCGVTGFACSVPVRGRHIFEPSRQMHNRGNGRGGGIAAMGFEPAALGVSAEMLEGDYILQIALMDPDCLDELRRRFVDPCLRIDHEELLPHIVDHRDIPDLTVRPPDIWRAFVRVRPEVLRHFTAERGLTALTARQAEDEFVYHNSVRINQAYYDALGRQRAFVMSHGRDLIVLKIVGYAEHVVQYYLLENVKAHVWIAHQRYPTKGRVWHPGGAHPFVGLNEALVHNGDFANYHSVTEYLRQRSIVPQFLTDTEVAVQLFDLYSRVYGYPLEYVIEALAPTMERDFDRLPAAKQKVYRALQTTHIHGSPDGPWFFIIARNDTTARRLQLIGITDTAMLRPQVFALHDGPVQVGLVCSEKQAIDATLTSMAREDPRIGTVADRYWNARGGSYTDGGAFIFNLDPVDGSAQRRLSCVDKFGQVVTVADDRTAYLPGRVFYEVDEGLADTFDLGRFFDLQRADLLFAHLSAGLATWDYAQLLERLKTIRQWAARDNAHLEAALEALNLLMDRRYATFDKKRRSILQMVHQTLDTILRHLPSLEAREASGAYRLIDWETRQLFRPPDYGEQVLVIDAAHFPPEGPHCDSRLLAEAYLRGWRRFIVFGLRGQRFHGCGLGPDSGSVRIDVYGSSGDYLASGADGLTIHVHGNAQDQLGQIMKSGKLVIHGDTGQTFMYGAKGGEVYVMGNAAGRPLINAVGRPRVVINGTCLDYLAESFMAGDPLDGGGFVILNGVTFDDTGRVVDCDTPYPGANLFSLASGGAVYLRDPHGKVDDDQLNRGRIDPLSERDWDLIRPYLEENAVLFGIDIARDLLTVDGRERAPVEVYRKVVPQRPEDLPAAGLDEWRP